MFSPIFQTTIPDHHKGSLFQKLALVIAPFLCHAVLNDYFGQVAVSDLISHAGVLVVHYRHSGSFPSNSIPVWVCTVAILAVVVGLVLHQVRVGFLVARLVIARYGIAVFASHMVRSALSSYGGVRGLPARHTYTPFSHGVL